jgi:prepilin-type N-terminal cleavage/methylation domain-containing protein/prepilin-type processing-associated H-X9-DG protein
MAATRNEPAREPVCRDRSVFSRRAFTLIELLVVVAIIALLIALLLPSLARARDQAQATVCAGQLKELTNATTMWLIESQQDKIKGNLGWGARALRNMKGQTAVFRCPADRNPSPRPAVFIRVYDSGTLLAEATCDGIFTKADLINPSRYGWKVGFDDSSSVGNVNGRVWYQADFDFNDAQFTFVAAPGQVQTKVVSSKDAGWDFRLSDYGGRVTVPANGAALATPIMWGSYGISASAGFRDQPARTIVLCETKDWSVFPESVADMCMGGHADATGSAGAPAQNKPEKLRLNLQYANGGVGDSPQKYLRLKFRHGGIGKLFDDVVEEPGSPQPRDQCNVGFLDAHVERLSRERLLNDTILWHPPRRAGWMAPF